MSQLSEHQEIVDEMKSYVANVIQEKVNGKIDKIHDILEKQNEREAAFHDKIEAHIAKVEPYIEGIEGAKSTGRIVMWAAGLVIAVGGAYGVIRNLLK